MLNNFVDQFRISCFHKTIKQDTITKDQGETFTKKEMPLAMLKNLTDELNEIDFQSVGA